MDLVKPSVKNKISNQLFSLERFQVNFKNYAKRPLWLTSIMPNVYYAYRTYALSPVVRLFQQGNSFTVGALQSGVTSCRLGV